MIDNEDLDSAYDKHRGNPQGVTDEPNKNLVNQEALKQDGRHSSYEAQVCQIITDKF